MTERLHTTRRTFLAGASGLVAAAGGAGVPLAPPAEARTAQSKVLRCGAVMTMDPKVGTLRNVDLVIRDGTIAAIGPDMRNEGEVIDARQMIAMPGFVDGHRHLWEGVVRDTLPIADLPDYLDVVNTKFGPVYEPEDVYLGTLVSALGALDAGITAVLDWSHIQNSPAHTAAAIRALRDSGIRAVFGYGPALRKDLGSRWPDDLLALRRREFASDDQLVTLALATISSESMPEDVVKAHLRLAREAGVLTSMHAGIAGIGTPGAIGKLGREGLLGPDVNLVHCNVLTPEEWRIVAATGTSVTLTPFIEMQMGHGDPAIQPARDAGVVPSLGADVETSAPGDMWTQMRTAFAYQRAAAFRVKREGKTPPSMMTPAEALRYATVGGAYATRLNKRIGTLEIGKAADVILLDMGAVNAVPVTDMESAILLNMDARNVWSVYVGGVERKRKGVLLNVDLPALRGKLAESRTRILRAAKLSL